MGWQKSNENLDKETRWVWNLERSEYGKQTPSEEVGITRNAQYCHSEQIARS